MPWSTTLGATSQVYGIGVFISNHESDGLLLGRSLAGKTTHDCLLMHTADVPQTFLLALGAYWICREVPEICANLDLVAAEDTRFLRIFTKLHIFNKETFPYDRVLFLDLDTLVLRGVDDIMDSGLKLAAVPCRSPRNERGEKLPVNAAEEGEALAAGTTFNGGVLLVSPQLEIFELLLKDSSWHRRSSHSDSHSLNYIADWSALPLSCNLCPRMGKGQALHLEWERLPLAEVTILHFSTQSKPYLGLWKRILALPSKSPVCRRISHDCRRIVQL